MIVYAFPEFMRFLLSLRYRGRLLQVSPCTGVYPPENLRFDIVMIFFFILSFLITILLVYRPMVTTPKTIIGSTPLKPQRGEGEIM